MSTENPYGTTSAGQSQSGDATGRSPEYDDGLTVQDTSHSATQSSGAPGTSATGMTGMSGGQQSTAGTHAMGDNHDGMGRDRTADVTADESGTLISADKVVGTAVYDAAGERLGTIDSIMLNKRSGKVAYAVMSFGGFLGIGERYHPLPWHVLTYDNSKGGYNVQHSADDLRRAPNYSRDEVRDFDYGTRSGEIDDYYGVNTARSGAGEHGEAEAPGDRSGGYGTSASGVESADAIGSTTGAGSSGMGSTGMGSNRNF